MRFYVIVCSKKFDAYVNDVYVNLYHMWYIHCIYKLYDIYMYIKSIMFYAKFLSKTILVK